MIIKMLLHLKKKCANPIFKQATTTSTVQNRTFDHEAKVNVIEITYRQKRVLFPKTPLLELLL